ncbi:YjiH family protein [uncultured Endozoicomonas sp.]|uniref:YjiH family protein n=1 Tax=uncultured Endozoicomonas sp. TaxID=432652 RepID=UPI0026021E91|nr:YjiH family protein [uncultured Endozoicomonas sp.]
MKQFTAIPKKELSLTDWLTFLVPSLTGILLFITPVSYNGDFTIPVAILANGLKSTLQDELTTIITIAVTITGVMTLLIKAIEPRWLNRYPFIASLLNVSAPWCLVRVIGMIFILATYFNAGPQAIWSSATGGMVLNDLMPTLFSVFIFAGLLLPLLMDFGLLELLGALMTKVMRPLFNLPGRSSINCIASWLGDGSVGILMTSKQYENSYYTQREAAIIGTTFSVVSITFSLVVAAQVGLEYMFAQFYLTVCLAGIVAAMIVPKLPPLSRKKDIFICGKARTEDGEVIPEGSTAFSWGMEMALEKAAKIKNPITVFQEGIKNAVDMVFGVLPVVMGVGTIALMIAEYTPVFQYLGMPFVPLLNLLQIPEAQDASTTMMIGFTDMFVPSILAASIENEMTRFVVAALSLTQLIYLSEVGALLLGSKIPVTLLELFIIFILRTLVTLPVIAGVAHILF